MEEIIVGIDIGTSKVCTLIGRINKLNQVEVLGKGCEPCNGIKKGIIVDIEGTSKAIRASIDQAESMSNLRVGSAYVNIFGTHVNVVNSRSSIAVANEDREISQRDVDRVLNSVKDIQVPEDRQIVDIIPRQYIIDGYDEIIDPVGMVGVKLEAEADIIVGKITSVQNIVKSMERASVRIDGIIVEALATAEVLLTPDEREMGVVMIDVGAGITDVSFFKGKKLVFYDSIPIGGDHITNDIALGLKISYAEAEKLKRQYELALTSLIKNDQEVQVFEMSENRKKSVKVSEIVEIIEARVHELFSLCKEMIERSGVREKYGAGIVLTGGGMTYVDGGKQLCEEVFGMPTRVGTYKLVGISKYEFTTAAGIIKYVSANKKINNLASEVKGQKQKKAGKENRFFKIFSKLFSDFFFTL